MATDWDYLRRTYGLTPDTHPHVPTGPIQTSPTGFMPDVLQHCALTDVLDGIELGAYDQRVITWLSGWDWPTVAVVASLIRRSQHLGGEQ